MLFVSRRFLLKSSRRVSIFTVVLLFCCCSCQLAQADVESWIACLKSPGGDLCFGLELEQTKSDSFWRATIVNGSERIDVPEVDVIENGDIVLRIEHYDSTLTLKRKQDQTLTGKWKKRRGRKKWVEMECVAKPTTADKQTRNRPNLNFDGRWSVRFESSDDLAVGIFKTDKKSGELRGTFLTTTGDYRFLSGSENQGQMRLSCFDGAHAFLFTASIQQDGTLEGNFWSSDTWHEKWTASRDETAKLADSFQATKPIKSSINTLTFPDLDGVSRSLADKDFLAPVRIVHIFGSWCPNCHDAGEYLAGLKDEFGDKISVVGVAFELTGDFERDVHQVREYLKRHSLDHTVLIGGTSNKAFATKAMKIVDEVRSYPTTIIAKSNGDIVAVHQGFSGPATGKAYEEQCRRFAETIDGILASKK